MMKYLCSIIALFILTACEVTESGNSNVQSNGNHNMYAMQATKYSWPPQQQGVVIAGNVLAKNYYLVMDGSGSMSDVNCSDGMSKIAVAKTSVQQFVNQIPSEANVGLLTFDENGVVPRVPLGLNREQIINHVEGIRVGGGTPLKRAIAEAYQALTLQAQSQLGYGEYHLVVVTDGIESPGENPSTVVNEMLTNSPVILHTIGFCIGEGHSLNVAGKTDYRAANNPEELRQGLAGVLAEASEYRGDTFNPTGGK